MRKHDIRGFTLMEMLVVIAIIAVLVAIAIPVISNMVTNAKIATDQANVRTAKSCAIAQYLSDGETGSKTYYFNGATTQSNPNTPKINGYGQYEYNDRSNEIGAEGTPNVNGIGNFVSVTINADQSMTAQWIGGGAYNGKNVLEANRLNSMSDTEKRDLDTLLFDGLTNQLRSMTYRELKEYFMNENERIKNPNYHKETGWGNTCFSIANSTIGADGTITSDHNSIYAKELFDAIGYDTSLTYDKSYLVTTATGYSDAYIKVDLGVNLDKMSDEELDQKASTAFAYVNGGGYGTPHNVLFNHDAGLKKYRS